MINIYKEGDIVKLDRNLETKYVILKVSSIRITTIYYHIMVLREKHITLHHVAEKFIYKSIRYE